MKHYPILAPALHHAWAKEEFQFNDLQSPLARAAMLVITQLRAVIGQIETMFPPDHQALTDALEWVGMISNALDEIEKGIDAEERLNASEEDCEAVDEERDWDSQEITWTISSGGETLASALDAFENCGDFGIEDDDGTDEFIQSLADYWLDDVLRRHGYYLLSILQVSVDPFAVIKSYEHLAGVVDCA